MSLLNAIKETPEIRKLFGKKELIIIEKQLQGVKLTPSEKTRLSRDIRKKFKAIQELAYFKNEFSLEQSSEIKRIVEDTKQVILDTKHLSKIKRIILFGSTADKSRTLLSDIDIAVEFKEIEEKEATKFRIHAMSQVNKKVDIQVYNFLPDKIKRQIDKYGKTIYARN